jgi:hypothetical protein
MKKRRWTGGTISTLALGYSLYVAYQGWGVRVPPTGPWPYVKVKQLVFIVLWTLLPPIWFWFEYFFDYLRKWEPGHEPPPDFDVFKYGQDVSLRVWLAASSVLLVLYFGKDIKLG